MELRMQKKECRICTAEGCFSVYRTITSLEDALDGCGFFRAHRSYLINLRKIARFDHNSVTFLNGETLEISARRYPELCKAYLKLN